MRWALLATGALAACGDNRMPAGEAAPDLVLALDAAHPGAAIPDDFLGASYETSTLIGGAYFAPDNAALVRTFAALGIRHLRIGGNEADAGPAPAPADIAAFAGFANAAAVRVIYTLRLATYDPAAAAATAGHVLASGLADLACFAIGNEPNFYLADYATYAGDVRAYAAAIADPTARYCGPDVLGDDDWIARYAADFPDAAATTVHFYYGNGAATPAADARERLLSAAIVDEYAANRAALGPGDVRLAETNSFFSGGCPGASDAFASALWGLDYLHWWAAHGAIGLDFHTGDHVSGASTTYSLFKTAPTGGYHVRPLGYAAAAFALGGHGAVVPVAGATGDVTAYAVLGDDGTTWLTIINKTHGGAARDLAIAIPGFTGARVWRLEAGGGDVAATDGVTLGGAAIADDATWAGTATFADGDMLVVPAASAAVVARAP